MKRDQPSSTTYFSCLTDDHWKLRVLVVVSLMVTTALAGYFPYEFYRHFEQSRAHQEYNAVVAVAEMSFQNGLSNKIDALGILDNTFRSHCPHAYQWPNCSISPFIFDTLSLSVDRIADIASIGMAPIVYPAQVRQFEEYASNVYLKSGITDFGIWSYPNSSIRGIAAVNASTRSAYHDTQKSPLSAENFLAPVLMFTRSTTNSNAARSVLFNIHSESNRITAMDRAVNCARKMSENVNMSCVAITDFVVPQLNFEKFPAAMTMHPVVMDQEVVAIVFTTHYWGVNIENSFPDYVEGLDVVIETSTASFTYRFNNGKVESAIDGDKHDKSYDNTKYSFKGILSGDGVEYTVSVYASSEYFELFEDNRAVYACIIGLIICVLTSLNFFVYDIFLSRSAHEHEVIIATKRAFVRYISHEIRTPLNTVNVGLKVLFQELASLPENIESTSSKSLAPNKSTEATSAQLSHGADSCVLGGGDDSGEASPRVEAILSEREKMRRAHSSKCQTSKKNDLIRLVTEIEESSDAAVGILNDLINYDKISMGTMRLDMLPVKIWEFLDETSSPFLIQARQKNIELTLDLQPFRTMNEEDATGERMLHSLIVIADKVKLSQVMRNLVSNALKFTPVGGVVIIAAHWERADKKLLSTADKTLDANLFEDNYPVYSVGNIVVKVIDSGAGISAEHQKELFQEGRQFNANRLQGGSGSGLGLFIAKGVVDLHRGALTALSRGEGEGCTFTMILPAVWVDRGHNYQIGEEGDAGGDLEEGFMTLPEMPPFTPSRLQDPRNRAKAEYMLLPVLTTKCGNEARDREEIAGKKDENGSTSSGNLESVEDSPETIRHLLVVDDSHPSRKMMTRLLTNAGYTCTQACDGQECVDLMIQNASDHSSPRFQMVFMDYEMPVMNGPQAAKLLRDNGFTVPIIGVTGNVLPEDIEYFIEHGATQVLPKPLQLSKLDALISSLCPSTAVK